MCQFVTDKNFEVKGSDRLALVQYMVGQEYSSAPQDALGDPAMALAVPVEQYRSTYRFLAPESFAQNFLNVIAKASAKITLDGKAVGGFEKIPGSDYQAARVKIGGGAHEISGTEAFGIMVSGIGTRTSYMYPGGLDLKRLK